MEENDISYKIRGCVFKVYNALGPGLLESVYVATLAHELIKEGLTVKTQVPVPVIYEGVVLELGFRLDMLVNDKVIIEVKSVETLAAEDVPDCSENGVLATVPGIVGTYMANEALKHIIGLPVFKNEYMVLDFLHNQHKKIRY